MAKKAFEKLQKNFDNSNISSKPITSDEQGTITQIDFNLIKKNPLNTGNDKSPEVIASLKKSIDTIGLMEPPIVYKDDKDGFYTLISGEGRITAIEELKKEKKCFDKITVVVRRKPINEDEELVWIITANEQRNTISIDRTRKNIRILCERAKRLADSGHGKFEELIESMSTLKKSSVYNYVRINEELCDELIALFDDDQLGIVDASFLCRYNKTEQKILMQHFYVNGKFKLDKASVDSILASTKSSDQLGFEEIEKIHGEIKTKDKEIKRLTKKLAEMETSNQALKDKILEIAENPEPEAKAELKDASKELQKMKKKNQQKEAELRKKEEEAEILREKLRIAEQMIPSLSDEEMKKIKSEQKIKSAITTLQSNASVLEKTLKKHVETFGAVDEEIQEAIAALGNLLKKIK